MAQPPRKLKKPTAARRRAPESVDRPSTIDRMDKDIQDEVFRLRFTQGRHLHEIIDYLKAMGVEPPSRTALGRHLKGLSDQMKAKVEAELALLSPTVQFANSFAEAVTAGIGEADGDNKLRATRELMQAQIFRMVVKSTGADGDASDTLALNEKQLFALSRTLQTLAQAERTEDARVREAVAAALAVAQRQADEEKKRAADAAKQIAKRGGLSSATAEKVFKAVMGE